MLFLSLIAQFSYGMVEVNIDETLYLPHDICEKIKSEKINPQIVAWYIGESGITKSGASFYKENIFDKFKTVEQPHKFHLYDLVAWQGLRNRQSSTMSKSKIAEHINKLQLSNHKSVHSSDFLQDIMSEEDENVIRHTRENILRNPQLYINSSGRRETGIKLREVLPARSLEPIHDLDTAHTYAALQYLEGIFLTKQIGLSQSEEKHQNVVFLLPNDEFKYYVSDQIEADMNILITNKIPADKRINVTFNSFRFGDSIQDRPYILRDKKLTKKDLDDLFK